MMQTSIFKVTVSSLICFTHQCPQNNNQLFELTPLQTNHLIPAIVNNESLYLNCTCKISPETLKKAINLKCKNQACDKKLVQSSIKSNSSNDPIFYSKTEYCFDCYQLKYGKISQKQEKIKQLTQQMENLNKQNEGIIRKNQSLNKQIQQLQISQKKTQKHNEELTKQIQKLKSQIEQQNKQILNLKKQITQKDSLTAKLTKQVENKKEQFQSLTNEYEKLKHQQNQVISRLSKQRIDNLEKLNKFNQQLKKCQKQKEQDKNQKNRAKQDAQQLMEKYNQLEDQLDKKKQEVIQLTKKLSKSKLNPNLSVQQIDSLNLHINHLQKQIQTLKTQNENLKTETQRLKTQIQLLRNQVNTVKTQKQTLKKSIEKHQANQTESVQLVSQQTQKHFTDRDFCQNDKLKNLSGISESPTAADSQILQADNNQTMDYLVQKNKQFSIQIKSLEDKLKQQKKKFSFLWKKFQYLETISNIFNKGFNELKNLREQQNENEENMKQESKETTNFQHEHEKQKENKNENHFETISESSKVSNQSVITVDLIQIKHSPSQIGNSYEIVHANNNSSGGNISDQNSTKESSGNSNQNEEQIGQIWTFSPHLAPKYGTASEIHIKATPTSKEQKNLHNTDFPPNK